MMRFAKNGLFIERYVKCQNCGVLIYKGDGLAEAPETFCSAWCRDWQSLRAAGATDIRLPFAADTTKPASSISIEVSRSQR